MAMSAMFSMSMSTVHRIHEWGRLHGLRGEEKDRTEVEGRGKKMEKVERENAKVRSVPCGRSNIYKYLQSSKSQQHSVEGEHVYAYICCIPSVKGYTVML